MIMHVSNHPMRFLSMFPITEVARLISLPRNTIKKWPGTRGRDEHKYVRRPAKTGPDSFFDQALHRLQTQSFQPTRDCRTLLALFRAPRLHSIDDYTNGAFA
ncbi:hypothetical protein [Dokdonella sp.]|uniref:hypothetical protein n=1 Tax=Dokdonella sp. TaxID=2291710 RepID=UPI003C691180